MTQFNFSKNRFSGAFAAKRLFPERPRRLLSRMLTLTIFLALFLMLYDFLLPYIKFLLFYGTGEEYPLLDKTAPSTSAAIGLLFLALSLKIPLTALNFFLNSKTSQELPPEKQAGNLANRLNLYSSEIWFSAYRFSNFHEPHKLAASLSQTEAGRLFLLRLGVTTGEYKIFRSPDAGNNLLATLSKNSEEKETTLKELVLTLFDVHKGFNQFLISRGLTREDVLGAAEWVEEELKSRDAKRRWWSRESLARIPGFAKDWAYGMTFNLSQFSRELGEESSAKSHELVGRDREVKLIESALLKGSGANLIIVGEPGGGRKTLLLGLVRLISLGKIFPELEHKKVLELQGPAIIASAKTKGEIEALLIRLLNEAVHAGNIILAMENFPEFVDSLEKAGVNAGQVLAPYLKSPSIHIVGLADNVNFRRMLEEKRGLMEYFVTVELGEPGKQEIIKILEDLLPPLESRSRVFMTYQALDKLAEGAINYIVEGALPKRAVDLLEEVHNEAIQEKVKFILPELVFEIIKRKTKIPLGEIRKGEREKLLNLEEELHKRVVNQEEAIRAIADAIRRARSGIRSSQKPIGTFLFLGPTGVGKTETSKALAETYFGREEAMVRLDMTEFQRDEDVGRLLGSFEKREQGILGAKMKSNPYSVLLLDEFEKSHEKVRNLFLQILDEGFFSDYLGEKINMRNTIIIATSNAGSSLIWELTEKGVYPVRSQPRHDIGAAVPLEAERTSSGVDAAGFEREILAFIQKEKIFTPELINRFDAVIIFRPLGMPELRKIATLMLQKLSRRLDKQNLKLEITEELIEIVAKGGQDPAFGARPMQRFIQDKVEKLIADKIIKGDAPPGSTLTLSQADFE